MSLDGIWEMLAATSVRLRFCFFPLDGSLKNIFNVENSSRIPMNIPAINHTFAAMEDSVAPRAGT